jgi:hypothetical protein
VVPVRVFIENMAKEAAEIIEDLSKRVKVLC